MKAGAIAGRTDVTVNFAKFLDYYRFFRKSVRNDGNLELKFNNFNLFLRTSIGCWLQIRCRICWTRCSAQLGIVFLPPGACSRIESGFGGRRNYAGFPGKVAALGDGRAR